MNSTLQPAIIYFGCMVKSHFGPLVLDLRPGVDFIKVGSTAQIIEIALSICTLCLRPTKIWAYGAIGCKPVYEIDPWEISFFPYLDCPSSQTASYLVLARKSLLVRAYACNAKT